MKKHSIYSNDGLIKIVKHGFFAFSLFVAATAYGQNQVLRLAKGTSTVKSVVKTIERQTKMSVDYTHDVLNPDAKVSVQNATIKLSALLDAMMEGKNLEYKIIGRHIIISRKADESVGPATPQSKGVKGRTITGTVIDGRTKEPIIGASVVVRGAKKATATDVDGHFALEVPDNCVLDISYIGYDSQSVRPGKDAALKVNLLEAANDLNEVVVVGYGTMRKSDLTGSVSQVKMEKLNDGVSSSMNNMLQGRTAGVSVVQSSGEPGAGFTVNIRGASSLNSGVAPLYVIDGVPIDNSKSIDNGYVVGFSASRTPRDPLATINPNDIESIEVLKDASATAIYGARGANGVIMVTTKQGKKGKGKISYSGTVGFQSPVRKLKLLNAQQYKTVLNQIIDEGGEDEIYRVGDIANNGTGTDWQDAIFRNSVTTDHELNYSGGNEKTTYYTSLGFMNQDGIVQNSSYRRWSARSNIASKINSWFDFTTNMTASYGRDSYAPNGYDVNENSGALYAVYNFDPTLPIYDENGDYYQSDNISIDNPYAILNGMSSNADTYRLLFSTTGTFHIISGLDAKLSLAYDYLHENRKSFDSSISKRGASAKGIGSEQNGLRTSCLLEGTLNYTRQFGKNRVNALAGMSFQRFKSSYSYMRSAQFPNESLGANNLALGAQTEFRLGNNLTGHKLMSYIGRLNYTYDDKYLATVTFRADGSSRFGANHRYSYFPSAALAWRAINEEFVKNLGFLSNLKLRASWGLTGNQEIGDFPSRTTYNLANSAIWGETKINGLGPTKVPNPDLKWETTAQTDLGLDVGFLNNRINLTVDYFWKNTRDMIMSLPIDQTTGYTSILSNVGKMSSQGVEVSINTTNISTPKFQWNTDFMFSAYKNRVNNLGGLDQIIISADYNHVGEVAIQKVGEPLNSYYGYKVIGIWQEGDDFSTMKETFKPGELKYLDLDGNGYIDDKDRVILGDSSPDFSWSINNEFRYKDITMSFLFDGVQGVDMLNGQLIDNYFPLSFRRNKVAELYLNRWTPQNPSTEYPSFDNPLAHGRKVCNSRTISDASYVRLRMMSLAYSLPKFTKAISNLQVYFRAENLFIITDYLGADPTVNSNATRKFRMDFNAYPSSRVFTFGVKVDF